MMRLPITFSAIVGLTFVLGCNPSSDNAGAGAPPEGSEADRDTTSAVAPDNTGINTRDRSDSALTPMDQGGSETDRQLTADIRKAVTEDQFSTYAKNIKIITISGKVTLRGPVKDAQELQAVETAVKAVPGVASVDNQLEPKSQTNQ